MIINSHMELLEHIDDKGYPTDYLLSRIRSRKTRYRDFISSESQEGVWKRLLIEYKWVYLQMNNQLRNVFHPFFIFHEMRTLIFCLRFKSANEHNKVGELLRFSLFSKELKGLIEKELNIFSAIENIEKVFLSISSRFGWLSEIYIKDGFKGFEQKLKDIYLGYVIGDDLHPVMRDFFMYLTDMRNITNLYKHIRWGIRDYPYFIQGGNIREERLRRVFKELDVAGLELLIHNLTGKRIDKTGASSIENSILKWLTVLLKRSGRDPLSIGVILDYLWRCYIETMNRSIILYGRGIDRDVVEADLV